MDCWFCFIIFRRISIPTLKAGKRTFVLHRLLTRCSFRTRAKQCGPSIVSNLLSLQTQKFLLHNTVDCLIEKLLLCIIFFLFVCLFLFIFYKTYLKDSERVADGTPLQHWIFIIKTLLILHRAYVATRWRYSLTGVSV